MMRAPIPVPPIVLVVNHGPDVDIHIIGLTGNELARVHTDLGEILEAGDLALQSLGSHPDAPTGWRALGYNHASRRLSAARNGDHRRGAVDGARDVVDVIDDIMSDERAIPPLVLGRAP